MSDTAAKILIIDYEPRGIKQMYGPLKDAGYEVLLAKDGLSGFQMFQKEKPDLVLIEAMLPKRHGFEVCLDIKRTDHGESTPVIIVTSVYKGRKYRTQALHQYNCNEYLEKPIAADTLLETVQRLLPNLQRQPSQAQAATAQVVSPSAPAVAVDSAEAEISDRLNEILFDSDDSNRST